MVPFTIPGELVRARITSQRKNYFEAELLEVLEPSPERVQPKCQYFGQCGGCDYQHMTIQSQRQWKQQQVEQTLRRIGGTNFQGITVSGCIGNEEGYGYRSKLTPHYEKGTGKPAHEVKVGFLHHDSNGIILDVDRCVIATDAINEQMPVMRQEAKLNSVMEEEEEESAAGGRGEGRKRKGKRSSCSSSSNRTASSSRRRGSQGNLLLREVAEGVVSEAKTVQQEVAGITYQYDAAGFFQTNPSMLPCLVDFAIQQASGGGRARFLVDAYAGCGLFSLAAAAAGAFDSCVGIEINALAVRHATASASLNGLKGKCTFQAGSAANVFGNVTLTPGQTACIIDPPRAGCDKQFLKQLLHFGPQRVVYVSCDPSTQARDAAQLVKGGYKVLDVTPFDLFPQTRHIEAVMTLERASQSKF
ncbi:unnamed protein product [Chrysoparadoxa australica]